MILVYVLMIALCIGAVAALLQKDLMRAAIISGIESVVLAVLFHALLAPDLALTQAIVGAILLPAIFIVVIFKTRRFEEE
ncbi:MAG: DUF4040 domain-containing protein [Candidatus Verstraetearchaeota archaeon]|nr:DUF4040 domain-containing protein [Candidatus Verstraetearchaeota archaeon]